MTPPARRCDGCGAWRTTWERIPPIYWPRASFPWEALDLLERSPHAVDAIVRDPRAVPGEPGPDGGWSAHQVLQHLYNPSQIFRGRIDQFLEGGEPELASVLVWQVEGEVASTSDLLDAYLELRVATLEALRPLPMEIWARRASHPEWGTVTLAEQASYFANHEPTHLAQLADAARV